MAPRQHLSPRRRRPPHTTVHRPGHGRGAARCDEPGVEAGRRGRRMALPERSWTRYEQERKPHTRVHDPTRARRGRGDDGGWRGGQSASPSGGSATASHPRPAGQDRRQRDARIAQQCSWSLKSSRTTAAGGPAVPEPGAGRRSTARRGRRRQVRSHHVGTAQPAEQDEHGTPRRRGRDVAIPGRIWPSGCGAGRATAAVVRPDRTVLCAGRNMAEVCDAVPVFAPPADTGADG